MTAEHHYNFPLAANSALYDQAEVEEYISTLFRNVDWQPGEVVSLLGIGEKGTSQYGKFREREFVPPAFLTVAAHKHFQRWAAHHVAGFIVPAVLFASAMEKGDVTLDKVAALTAIILDIDTGDTDAKRAFVTDRLGPPSMVVASGGTTEAGTPKLHLYWLLNEPSEDINRVAALRKELAAKVGGDSSFGRATQVIRVAGTVHAKNGKATVCKIVARSERKYDLDELADIISSMQPMPGVEQPEPPAQLPIVTTGGAMDFSPRSDTAVAALHRDVHENGEERTRWGEFSKVAGFHINEARQGRVAPQVAYDATYGWMLTHMVPAWPQERFDKEYQALMRLDVSRHGAMPLRLAHNDDGTLPIEYFANIGPSLKNNWLVRGLIMSASLALVYGAPGSGKSFFVLDLALRIALGWNVNGAPVKQGPVVYVGAEGQTGLRNRISAFRKHHDVSNDVPFAFVPVAVDLLDPHADMSRLIAAVEQATAHWAEPPCLIVIDTLAATFGGGDENTKDMLAYVNNIARLRDHFHATVLLVHHRPKAFLNNTPRGHSSLMGAMDTTLSVEHIEGRTVSMKKQKDAETSAPFCFELRTVQLGVDEDGEPVSSAVVDYSALKPSPAKLNMNALMVFDALKLAIERSGGVSASQAEWRQTFDAQLPDTTEDGRRMRFLRGKKELVAAGRVEGQSGLWEVLEGEVVETPGAMDFTPNGMD